ncbi:hypothetical protein ACWJJH_17450 [Endozoicomonadaceae bacterium StTr2]
MKPISKKISVSVYMVLLPFLLMAGCADQKVTLNTYNISANEQFVPINLDVNAGRYINALESKTVEHIYSGFENSGLFQTIETSFMRYPVTIKVKYIWKQRTEVQDVVTTAFSISTLMMVPAPVSEVHCLKVHILNGDEVIKTIELEETINSSVSLFSDQLEDRKSGINKMLERLFRQLRSEKLIAVGSSEGASVGLGSPKMAM